MPHWHSKSVSSQSSESCGKQLPAISVPVGCALVAQLNERFITDHLTDNDLVNYAYAVRDKVRENENVMKPLANDSDEQALLGDSPKAVDDAISTAATPTKTEIAATLRPEESRCIRQARVRSAQNDWVESITFPTYEKS